MYQHCRLVVLRQRQGLLGASFQGDGRRTVRLRLVAQGVHNLPVLLALRHEDLVGGQFMSGRVDQCFGIFFAEIVNRCGALHRRRWTHFLRRVAAAFL
ncbi:MAG: hypothetical protein P8X81_01785 [Woeseiaceae bacterium]